MFVNGSVNIFRIGIGIGIGNANFKNLLLTEFLFVNYQDNYVNNVKKYLPYKIKGFVRESPLSNLYEI